MTLNGFKFLRLIKSYFTENRTGKIQPHMSTHNSDVD